MAIAGLTVGNIVYAWLEEQPEADDQKAYQTFLNEILATTNISDRQFEALLSYTGRALRSGGGRGGAVRTQAIDQIYDRTFFAEIECVWIQRRC